MPRDSPSLPLLRQASPPPIAILSVAPASTGRAAQSLLAQLYLIKGPIVSNPPQTFSAKFSETGKAEVILSGRRILTGDFELIGLEESIKGKFKPSLVNTDGMKPSPGADAKGFAVLSDGGGTQLECAYSFSRSTKRGEGTCADNQRNTYSLVFD